MNKVLDDALRVDGKKSTALALGLAGGITILCLSVYLVVTKGDTGSLWPLITFTGSCLGFGAAEVGAEKKWGQK